MLVQEQVRHVRSVTETGRNTVVIFILGLSGSRLLLAARRRRR
ncbi:hypothetical protein ACFQO7_08450 [Catellatospora aurea]|uniref:LPXTG-motif cell wall-anchored protein n=1 Tax=Catellatospora aurea TaxID=1337874 RepID=A0ABW2GRD3_9ACTN